MWLCIPFPVRHQFNKGGFTVTKKSISYQIKHKFFGYNKFLEYPLNEANDVAIYILSHL